MIRKKGKNIHIKERSWFSMRWRTFMISGLALLLLTMTGAADHPAPVVGHFAPDFTLKDLITGKPVTLSAFRGQPVLIEIWSFICAPCLPQLAIIEEFQRAYGDLIKVLAISADPEPDLKKFLAEQFPKLGFVDKFGKLIDKFTLSIPLDKDRTVLLTYLPTRMPPLYFIDAQGVIRDIGLGFVRTVLLPEIVEIFATKVFQVRDPFLPLGPGLLKRLTVTAQAEKARALVERAELFDVDGDTKPEGVTLRVNLPQGARTVQLALWQGELRGSLPEEILFRVLGSRPLEGPELFIEIPNIDKRIVRSVQLQLNDEDKNPELVILDENQDGRVDAIRVDFDSDGKIDLQFP